MAKTPPRSETVFSSPLVLSRLMFSSSTLRPMCLQAPGSSEQETMRPLALVTKMSLPDISEATLRLMRMSQL